VAWVEGVAGVAATGTVSVGAAAAFVVDDDVLELYSLHGSAGTLKTYATATPDPTRMAATAAAIAIFVFFCIVS
jgi:hypothetical protein